MAQKKIVGLPAPLLWKGVASLSGMVTTMAVTRGVTALWERSKGKPVPDNPYDRRTSWKDALTWAVALGVGTSVARVLANRMSSAAWETATGSPPPGVKA